MTRAVSDSTPTVAFARDGDGRAPARPSRRDDGQPAAAPPRTGRPATDADWVGAGARPRGVAAAPRRPHLEPAPSTRQTAGVLSPHVQVDDRWIELDYGPYDEQPADALTPELWARWRADTNFTPPGVEPHAALASRVADACDELAAAARASVVLVVTHVSPIKAALAWALDVTHQIAWRMFVEDASVSRIDIESTGPVVRWFNRNGSSLS